MSRLSLLLLGIAALVPTLGSAGDFLIDCDNRCWEIGGAALLWKPCGKPYEYGVAFFGEEDEFTIKDLRTKAGYDWGFRLFGATYTNDCCHLFSIDWTYLRTTDTERRSEEVIALFPVEQDIDIFAVAHSKLKHRYNKVNVRAGRYTSQHCKSLVHAFGGARYVDIERQQAVTVVGIEDDRLQSFEKARFEGGALEIGAGVHVTEPCGFSIVGLVSGVAAIGQRTLKQNFIAGPPEDETLIIYEHPSETICIPGMELRIGAEYRYECGCYWFNAEIGYQMDYYWNALRLMTPTFNEDIAGTAPTDAGFAGPYFQLSARF